MVSFTFNVNWSDGEKTINGDPGESEERGSLEDFSRRGEEDRVSLEDFSIRGEEERVSKRGEAGGDVQCFGNGQ